MGVKLLEKKTISQDYARYPASVKKEPKMTVNYNYTLENFVCIRKFGPE